MQEVYANIYNPTDSMIYVNSISFTTSGGDWGYGGWGVVPPPDGPIQTAIGYFANLNHYGLPVPPHSYGWPAVDGGYGPVCEVVGGGEDLAPSLRGDTTTFTMHLMAYIAPSFNTVIDVGDIDIVANPYLPIVSDLNGKVFHVSASGGPVTVPGSIWNAYGLIQNGWSSLPINEPMGTAIPLISADSEESGPTVDGLTGPVKLLGQNLISYVGNSPSGNGRAVGAPGEAPVAFTGPYGMFVLQVAKGTPSFTGRLLYWANTENYVVGYSGFQGIVGPLERRYLVGLGQSARLLSFPVTWPINLERGYPRQLLHGISS